MSHLLYRVARLIVGGLWWVGVLWDWVGGGVFTGLGGCELGGRCGPELSPKWGHGTTTTTVYR